MFLEHCVWEHDVKVFLTQRSESWCLGTGCPRTCSHALGWVVLGCHVLLCHERVGLDFSSMGPFLQDYCIKLALHQAAHQIHLRNIFSQIRDFLTPPTATTHKAHSGPISGKYCGINSLKVSAIYLGSMASWNGFVFGIFVKESA